MEKGIDLNKFKLYRFLKTDLGQKIKWTYFVILFIHIYWLININREQNLVVFIVLILPFIYTGLIGLEIYIYNLLFKKFNLNKYLKVFLLLVVTLIIIAIIAVLIFFELLMWVASMWI